MDFVFERDWQVLLRLMEERFGEPPDLTTLVFTVGLQEAGQGYRPFKKDEKVELMHVGVCTLLEPFGFYELVGHDEQGWPHFRSLAPIPAVTREEQEWMIRRALVEYFAAWIAGEQSA